MFGEGRRILIKKIRVEGIADLPREGTNRFSRDGVVIVFLWSNFSSDREGAGLTACPRPSTCISAHNTK